MGTSTLAAGSLRSQSQDQSAAVSPQLDISSSATTLTSYAATELRSALAAIVERASYDEKFRDDLVQNPIGVLGVTVSDLSAGAQKLSPDLKLRTLEENDHRIYLDLNGFDVDGPLGALILKAREDASILAEIKRDPKLAIEKFVSNLEGTPFHLPANIVVEVVNSNDTEFNIILPRRLETSAGTASTVDVEGIAVGILEMSTNNGCSGQSGCGGCWSQQMGSCTK